MERNQVSISSDLFEIFEGFYNYMEKKNCMVYLVEFIKMYFNIPLKDAKEIYNALVKEFK